MPTEQKIRMRDFMEIWKPAFSLVELPKDAWTVCAPFVKAAEWMFYNLPDNDQRALGLRKLLEARDCALRAHIVSPSHLIMEPN